jgi:uncharacterized membrane protein
LVRRIPLALVLVALVAGCGGDDDESADGNGGGGTTTTAEAATFEQVQGIVEQRCVPCHSPNPTLEGFEAAQAIDLSNPDNIEANRVAINQVVVVEQRMPLNNETNMTDEERDRIASWAASG